ncbi:ABC transporter [Thermoanaerobacterium sp. RBIITD]|nr:ATP-binding cassette domain-containing protein [Thermoanaerobacterium sp. RBIITD]SNX53237.1 ABC transporter [Thermoanaerobacterium sp. RBIITD]
MIEVYGLTEVFKNIKAVDSLSFQVKEGEVYGLLGENGAGKTTTLRMLATILKPTNGTAKMNGIDLIKEPKLIRKGITPITLLALVPAYMLMYKMPSELPQYCFMIPIFSTISIFKELLYGIVNISHIGIFVVSSLIYIIAAIYIASSMFKQEWSLFRV